MVSFVAFFDILGTSQKVMQDEFSDLHALDFANPVGIVAGYNPDMRFSVFSDSVIISAPKHKIHEFVSVIAFLYTHWFADAIFVRSGISFGEMRWVDELHVDNIFRKFGNLVYSRVYGKALINAHNVQEQSGPGAICFVDEFASIEINKNNSKFIIDGYTNMLVWTTEKQAVRTIKLLNSFLIKGRKINILAERQYKATVFYFKSLLEQKKYLDENYLLDF